jgi:glycosyltransferase involved in cell wall biosynthesis
MVTHDVDIVLPCHHAAAWLDAFVNPLLSVNVPSWRLVARDDDSTDDTFAILLRWQARLGERMLLLRDSSGNLGVTGNYTAVLAATTAPWVLTADPDDVWLPNHLSLTLDALRAAEASHGARTPIAVGTDAIVVDGDLGVVAPSFWRWSHMRRLERFPLRRVALESLALGSTMAINRALIETALPIPKGAAYQDWWLALVAAAFGQLVLLPEPTIHYRRHGQSLTKDPYAASLTGAFRRMLKAPRTAHQRLDFLIRQAGAQARAFLENYEARLSAGDIAALRALASLPDLSAVARRAAVVRHGLWFTWWAKNLGLLAFL